REGVGVVWWPVRHGGGAGYGPMRATGPSSSAARAGAGAPGAGSEAARAARAGEPAAGIARHAAASRGGRAVRLERGAGLPVPARIPQHGAELPEARGGPGGQRVTSGAQGAVLPAVR